MKHLVILEKNGWPVETFRGRPVMNLIRYILHGRKIVSRKGWEDHARKWMEDINAQSGSSS